jgi:hypothetical protein
MLDCGSYVIGVVMSLYDPTVEMSAQDVVIFLVDDREFTVAAAISEMNGVGKLLRWRIARIGNRRILDPWGNPDVWAPQTLFTSGYRWSLQNGDAVITPDPTRRAICYDVTRIMKTLVPSGSGWAQDLDQRLPAADITLVTRRTEVLALWPSRTLSKSSAGAPPRHDWEEGQLYLEKLWAQNGDPKLPMNGVDGWRSDTDIAKAVQDHMAKLARNPSYQLCGSGCDQSSATSASLGKIDFAQFRLRDF